MKKKISEADFTQMQNAVIDVLENHLGTLDAPMSEQVTRLLDRIEIAPYECKLPRVLKTEEDAALFALCLCRLNNAQDWLPESEILEDVGKFGYSGHGRPLYHLEERGAVEKRDGLREREWRSTPFGKNYNWRIHGRLKRTTKETNGDNLDE